MACYVTNTTPYDNSGAKACVFPLEDYLECLHHKKEVWASSPPQHFNPQANGWDTETANGKTTRSIPQEGDVITGRRHEDSERG
jgi:hypothetical protein